MKFDASKYKTAEMPVEDFMKQILRWDFGKEKTPLQRMCEELDSHVEMFERGIPDLDRKIGEIMRNWPRKGDESCRYLFGYRKPPEAFIDLVMARHTDIILSERYFREYIRLRHEALTKGVTLNTEKLYVALFDDEVEACLEYIARASPGEEARCEFPRRRIFTGEKYETYLVGKTEKIIKITVPEGEGEEGGSILWTERI